MVGYLEHESSGTRRKIGDPQGERYWSEGSEGGRRRENGAAEAGCSNWGKLQRFAGSGAPRRQSESASTARSGERPVEEDSPPLRAGCRLQRAAERQRGAEAPKWREEEHVEDTAR